MPAYCDFSFDDLFRAAHGREMKTEERAYFGSVTQDVRNEIVRRLVLSTGGEFECADVTGTDGLAYTSFWKKQ